ncbi:MAG: hypothetical protein ACLTQG_31665 [Hungatella sp.]
MKKTLAIALSMSMAAGLMTGCAHIASHICVKRGIDKNLPLARQWARY